MEIDIKKNIYMYGAYYDASRVDVPKKEHNWTTIIVYINPDRETERKICSIEGYFVAEGNKLAKFSGNTLCVREQMPDFEKKYHGKFFPFEK